MNKLIVCDTSFLIRYHEDLDFFPVNDTHYIILWPVFQEILRISRSKKHRAHRFASRLLHDVAKDSQRFSKKNIRKNYSTYILRSEVAQALSIVDQSILKYAIQQSHRDVVKKQYEEVVILTCDNQLFKASHTNHIRAFSDLAYFIEYCRYNFAHYNFHRNVCILKRRRAEKMIMHEFVLKMQYH